MNKINHQSNLFWVDLDNDQIKDNGEDFIIWSWKGDYTNMGAGGETGIYRIMDGEKDKNGNYLMYKDEYRYLYTNVDINYSVDMELSLFYDRDKNGKFKDDENVFDYNPKEKQWWITGFEPSIQNVKAKYLKEVVTINFSSYGDKAELFCNAFMKENSDEWEYSDEKNYTVTLVW